MPELYYTDGVAPVKDDDDDDEPELEDWMKDLPPQLLQAIMGGQEEEDNVQDGVADLLVSQTETADLVVMNKCDLVEDTEVEQLSEIVQALNPRAKILKTAFGKLPVSQVLAVAEGKGVVQAGAVDDHRDAVEAVTASIVVEEETVESSSSHSHSHDHSCDDPDCTDSSHSHSHSHDHSCDDPDCTDPSHSHSHSHDHSCDDPDCTDSSHSHSHSHDHSCDDPNCTDPSHSHSHSHDHNEGTETHAGIGSFVYRARRPFHPGRLVSFLQYLPVVRGIPEQNQDPAKDKVLNVSSETQEILSKCLRSKGFAWCADSHTSAMYWSHAGSSFELSCLGQWWATLPRDQWPEGVTEYVVKDFDFEDHDDTTNPIGVGDRRQEIVFIGKTYAVQANQKKIVDTLNQCLLRDEEYEEYQQAINELGDPQTTEEALNQRFENSLDSKYVTY